MRDRHSSAEVVVVGAGPAGCAAALQLARGGLDVLLLERGGPGRPAAVETAPAGLWPLLQALGLDARVREVGFAPAAGAWVQWAGPARALHEPVAGLQLERARFDALLRQAAREAGVRWLDAAAMPPVPEPDAPAGGAGRAGWQLPLHDGRRLHAAALLWATGRAGPALPGAPASAALVAHWAPGAGPRVGEDTRACVQAGPEGWAWAAPAADGGLTVALFLDPHRLRGLDGAARQALYQQALAHLRLIAPRLAGRTPGPLRVADATPRWRALEIGARAWRIGDAALALDPLSSQGVVGALRGGLQAAAAMRTALRRPADAGLALAFLQARQAQEAERHRQWAAAFQAQAAQAWGTPFWRRGAPAAAPAPWSPGAPVPPLPGLATRLRLDPRARAGRAPVLANGWIVEAPVLDHPGLDGPVAQVQGRAISDWLADLQPQPRVDELLQRWAARIGAPRATALLQGWWRQGVVVEARPGSPAPAHGGPRRPG